jgi:pyruvate,water dikinase
VLRSHADLGRLQGGDVLVTSSTDPGWTPAFLVVGAVVCETGGMLAHFSCLSREYGLPAVQLANAMRLIPDGATVTVNGETGTVQLAGTDESR